MESTEFIIKLSEFEKKLQTYHMPRFRELPDIELYMDQVISYVNKYLNVFNSSAENLITPSMINNYVKHGILPPPAGKKYSRIHLAYICVIFFLKQILSLEEIKNIIRHQVKESNEFKAYTYFCQELEEAFKNCCIYVKRTDDEKKATLDETKFALKSSTVSIAHLLYAKKVIALQAEADLSTNADTEKDKDKKKKDKDKEKENKDKKKDKTNDATDKEKE